MCPDCQMVECDRCDNKTLNYETTIDGEWICEDCMPKCDPKIFQCYEENEDE